MCLRLHGNVLVSPLYRRDPRLGFLSPPPNRPVFLPLLLETLEGGHGGSALYLRAGPAAFMASVSPLQHGGKCARAALKGESTRRTTCPGANSSPAPPPPSPPPSLVTAPPLLSSEASLCLPTWNYASLGFNIEISWANKSLFSRRPTKPPLPLLLPDACIPLTSSQLWV